MRDLKLWIPLLVFLISFAATYPSSIVLKDEANYIRQAHAFAKGNVEVEYVHPITEETTKIRPSDYPPGTSLIITPLIYINGWQFAFWMPALALFLTVLFTSYLLKRMNLHPAYSLLLFIYPPALIMSRVVSSDVISATTIALGWLLFWISSSNKSSKALSFLFLSGLIAGLSMLIRETNALFFAPLYFGAFIRKDRGFNWLLAGGLIGLMIRLIVSYLIFGDPLFTKTHAGFSFTSVFDNFLLYLIALIIFVPGGLFFVMLYKGPRKPEFISTVFFVFIFYLLYNWNGESSGFLKSLILGPRFFIPLLPLFAIVMAEVSSRLFHPIFEKFTYQTTILYSGLLLMTFGIILTNVLFHQWSAIHTRIQDQIEKNVQKNAAVITNEQSTIKYLSELQGYPSRINYDRVSNEEVNQMDDTYIVFLQRSESSYWRETANRENQFLERVHAEPVFNQEYLNNYSLKIYRTE